jgi:hypothetical protein
LYLLIEEEVDLVCILGGDLENGGATLGNRTLEHLKVGSELCRDLREEGRQPHIVLSAGLALDHGLISKYPRQRKSLAAMMEDHLIRELKVNIPIHIPRLTWGTRAELESIKLVEDELREQGKYVGSRRIVVSWWHAPRTTLDARSLFGDEFEIHETPADLSIEESLVELRNIIGEWLRQYIPGFGTVLRFVRGRD